MLQLYVSIVHLSTQDYAKLIEKLEYFFKRTIKWNEYQSKVSRGRPNQCLDYLIDWIFQGSKRPFVLSFENNAHQTSYKQYFLPPAEIKDYNFMINGKRFFDQPGKNNL